MSEALPAITLAEEIMLKIFQSGVDVEACNKASNTISHYQAGEGTLWGIMDLIKHDRMDGRFYDLKDMVVGFIRELMSHKDYYLVASLQMRHSQELAKKHE